MLGILQVYGSHVRTEIVSDKKEKENTGVNQIIALEYEDDGV